MQWNDLSYNLQKQVYDRLEKVLLEEQDIEVQDAIVAAMTELEHWDNSPCPVQVEELVLEFPMAVQAQDAAACCNCIIPLFCRCYCHKKVS